MITLIGATGFKGTLIAHELRRLGCTVSLAARDEVKLERLSRNLDGEFSTALVDVTKAATLPRAFEGSNVVINCAGPFIDLGELVVHENATRLRTVAVAGRDPYGLTAMIAAGVAAHLDKGNVENKEAITPSMAAGWEAIVESTSAAGVSWSVL